MAQAALDCQSPPFAHLGLLVEEAQDVCTTGLHLVLLVGRRRLLRGGSGWAVAAAAGGLRGACEQNTGTAGDFKRGPGAAGLAFGAILDLNGGCSQLPSARLTPRPCARVRRLQGSRQSALAPVRACLAPCRLGDSGRWVGHGAVCHSAAAPGLACLHQQHSSSHRPTPSQASPHVFHADGSAGLLHGARALRGTPPGSCSATAAGGGRWAAAARARPVAARRPRAQREPFRLQAQHKQLMDTF